LNESVLRVREVCACGARCVGLRTDGTHALLKGVWFS